MKITSRVSSHITSPSSRCCGRWERRKKTQTNIWEGIKMAQQLEELEQEIMSPNGSHESIPAPEEKPAPVKEDRPSLRKRLGRRPLIAAAALIVLIAGGLAARSYFGSYESTDDAQVDGHLHPVSARINGTIVRVNPDVENNHFVTAGTVLAVVFPADFQAEREHAQADFWRLKAGSVGPAKDIPATVPGSHATPDV